MSDSATRQHYKLATGEGLDSAPSGKKSTFAKGGRVPDKRPMKGEKPGKSGGRGR